MSYQEIIIVLILFIWLVISVCYAIFNNRIAAIVYQADMFRLLSAFQLFSGKIKPLRLSYRDLLADNSPTQWKEVALTHPWRLYHAIWFPQNMVPENIKSIMDDLVRITQKAQRHNGSKRISDRFIYHALFQFLKRYPQDEANLGRQFRICDWDNRNLFISDCYNG